RGEWAILGVCALLFAGVTVAAFGAAPNNWDALAYHLPRQVMWMQQHSLAAFATSDSRMLEMPPLAEFCQLHLMLLSGSDHWANPAHLAALPGAAITGSLLCPR